MIFDANLDHVCDAAFAFYKCGLGLYPDEEDVIGLIYELERRRSGQAPDLAMLEELVLLALRSDGISAEVRAAAAKVSGGSTEFAAKLAEWSKPIVYDWQKKQADAARKCDAERAKVHQTFRDRLTKDIAAVDAGAPNLLYDPAKAYLARFTDFDKDAPPQDRVYAFLGSGLADRVLNGFMATFDRGDRPSAREIAEQHVKEKIYFIELSLVCGVAERLRRGLGLADLSVESREAAFMAWRRTTDSQISGGIDLAPLEAAVLCDDAAIERFFRRSIETQLEAKRAHVCDLYFLAHDARWGVLAGRLAVEWLRKFSSLPATVESELMDCATRHAKIIELRALNQTGGAGSSSDSRKPVAVAR